MVCEVLISVLPEEEKNENLIKAKIFSELKKNHILRGEKYNFVFLKRSVDARRKNIKINLKYRVYIDEEISKEENFIPQWKSASGEKTVVIIGSGPAGLFAALTLLESGVKPVIIERGCETSKRRKDIALISREHYVDENSNYCFGEGGAGTFSDGKLYTRSNKRGNIKKCLQILVHFGADEKILTDSHPHIGTEKLPKVINNIRNFIISLGGEFHFSTKCIAFLDSNENIIDSSLENQKECKISGVLCENLLTLKKVKFLADAVILATGHSADDIYYMIAKVNPHAIEAKAFSCGVRVEHPRSLIDFIQFHGRNGLEAAEYSLTSQVASRGVYSFCMCPGGFVVPSSSCNGEIVVNGMSASARNSKWSNSAIVVEVYPEDVPEEFIHEAEKIGSRELSSLLFRKYLEKKAGKHGLNQMAPSQMMKDFLDGKKSVSFPEVSYTPGIKSSRLDLWLPEHISKRLKEAFKIFDKKMKGFISDKAVLIAIETRTSTPVRILRNPETFESTVIKSLYPCGEGSGYSGGIVSSAMDGENAASRIVKSWQNQ